MYICFCHWEITMNSTFKLLCNLFPFTRQRRSRIVLYPVMWIYSSSNDFRASKIAVIFLKCQLSPSAPPKMHSTLTSAELYSFVSFKSFFFFLFNWGEAIMWESINQLLQTFLFIKHKGAQTEIYSGCKWSKCKLEKKNIIRFITQINSSSQPFKSLYVFSVKREQTFFLSLCFQS